MLRALLIVSFLVAPAAVGQSAGGAAVPAASPAPASGVAAADGGHRAAAEETAAAASPGSAAASERGANGPDLSGAPPAGAEDGERESLAWVLVRTLVVLGLVVMLVYVTLNVGLRKLMGAPGLLPGRKGLVKVLDVTHLDPKRTLLVVHAAGDYFLVGASEQSVSLVARLESEKVEKALSESAQASSPAAPSAFLQRLLSKRDKKP